MVLFKRLGVRLYQIAIGLILAGLAACATPSTSYPVVPLAEIEEATLVDQRANVEARLDRLARANAIAWPLLEANADLCHDRRADRFGISIGNDKTIRGLADGFTLRQVNAIGYDSAPIVLNVTTGSPAARAGIVRGSVPVQVGETEIDGKMKVLNEALADYIKARETAKEARGESDVQLPHLEAAFRQPDGSLLEVDMTPAEICSIPINVTETDAVNASTGGTSVNVYRGLMTYFEDNEDVAIVIAHEIGHVIGRHVPKQRRNSYVSGFALWGIPVGLGAGLFDGLFGGALERWGGVETPPGRASMTRIANGVLGTRRFEREADYLGMYIAARSGLDISNAEAVFAGFAKLSPRSTYGERTHPITAERQLALKAAREEIVAMQAAGETLIPNDWPYPVALADDADGGKAGNTSAGAQDG